jgi:hypothetical protein
MSGNVTGHRMGCRTRCPAAVPCKCDLLKADFQGELPVRHGKVIGFRGQSQVPLPMYPIVWTDTVPRAADTTESRGFYEMPAALLSYCYGGQLCEFSTPHNCEFCKMRPPAACGSISPSSEGALRKARGRCA